MNTRIITIALICISVLSSCDLKQSGINPPAKGFDMKNSDSKAIALADKTMEAMGGRKNWDKLRYISWNFWGNRDLIWDKKDHRVRITIPKENTIFLLDMDTMEGRASIGGEEIIEPDSLHTMLENAYKIWINDSYWLVMPFKLKDSGVTLKYNGEDTTKTGIKADVVSLTFKDVGVTPDNKYLVYIDKTDHLVKQWAYYKSALQDTASAIWPWDNYKEYNGVLLSGDRSDNGGPRNIKVYDDLPEATFEEFEEPEL